MWSLFKFALAASAVVGLNFIREDKPNWKDEVAQLLTSVINNLEKGKGRHHSSLLRVASVDTTAQESTGTGSLSGAAQHEIEEIVDDLQHNRVLKWEQYVDVHHLNSDSGIQAQLMKRGDIDPETKKEVAAILNGILGRLTKDQ